MQYLIGVVFLLALAWFGLIRPQRRRLQAQHALRDDLVVGDEILTAGGLFARVTQLGDEEIRAEVAPGTTVRLDRRAVLTILPAEEQDDPPGTESPPPAGS